MTILFKTAITFAATMMVFGCGSPEDMKTWGNEAQETEVHESEQALSTQSTFETTEGMSASAGDLCPNQASEATVCVGAARCRCTQQFEDTLNFLAHDGVCEVAGYICATTPITNRKEACRAAKGDVDEPAECNSGDVYPPLCADAGVTGPNTKKDGPCCTAKKVRGCTAKSDDLSQH